MPSDLADLLPWPPHDPWILVTAAVLLLAVLLRPRDSALRRDLAEMDRALRRDIATQTAEVLRAAFEQVRQGQDAMQGALAAFRVQVSDTLDGFGTAQARDLDGLRRTLADHLERLQRGNEQKLDAMRETVDHKLQTALESRIGESFQRVTAQFAEVQQAIGQVQSVAAQVGDLRKLFSNVARRGGWGEAQAEALLEELLPGAYVRNLHVRDGGERVEFALRMPVKGAELWLPIDAKFPTEDYARLLAAAESGTAEDEALARRGLERSVRDAAARIARYIAPPRTVDYALMYLPSDSLFAEVARIPGLLDQLRRGGIVVMAPSLLPAFLHALRLGHVTLGLERKTGEIAETLRAVKTEWQAFGESIDVLARRAQTLAGGVDDMRRRVRAVERALHGLDAMESDAARRLLGVESPGA